MTAGHSGGSYPTDRRVLIYCHSSEALTVDGLQADARSSRSASPDAW
jgi:hypothetical protein